jgi:hypothetical protein
MIEQEDIIYLHAIVRINEDGSKDERRFAATLNERGKELRKNNPHYVIEADHIETLMDLSGLERINL